MRRFRRVLLGAALLLCLTCVSTIGLLHKAYASSKADVPSARVWCAAGNICGTERPVWGRCGGMYDGHCGCYFDYEGLVEAPECYSD